MNHRAVAATAAAAMLSASCLVHEPARNPKPTVPVPAGYDNAGGSLPPPERWWQEFGDPQLTALVDRALAGNLQLAGAWARVDQATALARQAGAGRWPQVNLSGSASRSRRTLPFGGGALGDNYTANNYNLSVGASYEVDLWRRVGSGAKASALDALAARDDLESIAISLAANVVEAYFDVLFAREQQALLATQLETDETFEELVKLRFEQGLGASALDVYQARQQATATRAQLALAQGMERVAEYRLAVLLGQPPGSVKVEGAALPPLPALPGTGVPGDLILRRPDVRAMQRRVEAADWRVAAAVAARLPTLSLSANAGFESTNVEDLFGSPIYNLAANLLGPIFDAGARKANADRSKAVVAELVASYGSVLLNALLEVESALVLEDRQRAHIEELERQVELGQATLREARTRYREGIDSFLPVLTSLTSLHRGELSLLSARRQLVSYRIQLCRALGGTWTSELAKP